MSQPVSVSATAAEYLTRIMTRSPYDAFVSYRHVQQPFVDLLHARLEQQRLNIWLDKEPADITGGVPWQEEIETGIISAKVFVCVLDIGYFKSKYCREEFEIARALDKTIISIVLERPEMGTDDLLVPVTKRRYFLRRHQNPARRYTAANNLAMVNSLQGVSLTSIAGELPQLLRQIEATPPGAERDTLLARFDGMVQIGRVFKYIVADGGFAVPLRDVTMNEQRWRKTTGYFNRQNQLLSLDEARRKHEWAEEYRDRVPAAIAHYIQTSYRVRVFWARTLRSVLTTTALILFLATLYAVAQRNQATFEQHRAEFEAAQAIQNLNTAQNALQLSKIEQATRSATTKASPSAPLRLGQTIWVSDEADTTVSRYQVDRNDDSGEALAPPLTVCNHPQAPLTDGQFIWIVSADTPCITRINPATSPLETRKLTLKGGLGGARILLPQGGAGGALWVATADGQLTSYDRLSLVEQTVAQVGAVTQALVADGEALWVIGDDSKTLYRVPMGTTDGNRVASASVISSLPIQADTLQPVWAADWLWYTDRGSRVLHAVRWQNGQLSAQQFALDGVLSAPYWDGQWLWLLALDSHRLIRFSPATGHTDQAVLEKALSATRLFAQQGRLWVLAGDGLAAFDPVTLELLGQIALAGNLALPVSSGDQLWFANRQDNALLVVDARSVQLTWVLSFCNHPTRPWYDGANMWVSCRGEQKLKRIPARLSYYALSKFGEQSHPTTPVYAAQFLWFVQQDTGTLVRIDPRTGQAVRELALGTASDKLSAPIDDGRYLWVFGEASGIVYRVDPTAEQDVRSVAVGGALNNATVFDANLWVVGSNLDGPDLSVIDRETLRIVLARDFGIGASRPVPSPADHSVWLTSSPAGRGALYHLSMTDGHPLSEPVSLGTVNAEPLLLPDTIWVTSVFGEGFNTGSSTGTDGLATGVPSRVYIYNRADTKFIKSIELGRFASVPILGGDYLWFTQSSLGIFGSNEQAITAVDPRTLTVVKSWSLCQNVSRSFYDPQSGLIWFVCINLDASETGQVLVIDTHTLQVKQQYPGLGRSAWPAVRIDDTVWIVFQGSDNAALFKASDGSLIKTIGLGRHPSLPVSAGLNSVWIANTEDSTVQQVQRVPDLLLP